MHAKGPRMGRRGLRGDRDADEENCKCRFADVSDCVFWFDGRPNDGHRLLVSDGPIHFALYSSRQHARHQKWCFTGLATAGTSGGGAGGPAPDFLNHILQWVPRSSRSLRRAGTMPMVPRDFRLWKQRTTREKRLVGERGFEPPTPWSRTRCSTRLSHSPTW